MTFLQFRALGEPPLWTSSIFWLPHNYILLVVLRNSAVDASSPQINVVRALPTDVSEIADVSGLIMLNLRACFVVMSIFGLTFPHLVVVSRKE